jgi:hypothetical protein
MPIEERVGNTVAEDNEQLDISTMDDDSDHGSDNTSVMVGSDTSTDDSWTEVVKIKRVAKNARTTDEKTRLVCAKRTKESKNNVFQKIILSKQSS